MDTDPDFFNNKYCFKLIRSSIENIFVNQGLSIPYLPLSVHSELIRRYRYKVGAVLLNTAQDTKLGIPTLMREQR